MGSCEVCSLTSFCSFKEAALWLLAPLKVLLFAKSLSSTFTQSTSYLASITLTGTDLPEPRAGAEPSSGLPDTACSFQPGRQILLSYRQTSGHKDTESCQQNQKDAQVIILNERFRSSGLGFNIFLFQLKASGISVWVKASHRRHPWTCSWKQMLLPEVWRRGLMELSHLMAV